MMNEIKTLKYHRAVIPDDVVDTNVETLDFWDASKDITSLSCMPDSNVKTIAVHVNLYSHDKFLITDNMTKSWAELYPILITTHTAGVVTRAFRENH